MCLLLPNSAHGDAKPRAMSQSHFTAESTCSANFILDSNINESDANGEDMLLIWERRCLWSRHTVRDVYGKKEHAGDLYMPSCPHLERVNTK